MYTFIRVIILSFFVSSFHIVFGQISEKHTKNELAPGTRLEPGKLVFKLKPEFKTAASLNNIEIANLQKALTKIGAKNLRVKYPKSSPPNPELEGTVDLSLIYQIYYNTSLPLTKVKSVLMATGVLEYVEPLYYRGELSMPNDPLADSASGPQWYLKLIKAYQAWDLEQGDSTTRVAVTDVGYRKTHTELIDNAILNYADPVDGIDNDSDGLVDNYEGWDFADGDNDVSGGAHGTQVTGVISAATNNNLGMAGVGHNVRFTHYKVFPTTANGVFGGFDAIVHAADKGFKIINMSWGGVGYPSKFEQDIMNYAAINHDVVLVAAAGNTDAELDFYPSSYNNVISVAATTSADEKGGSHTYSHFVDLSAPGVSIRTTSSGSNTSYASAVGSSYSAPMVSATAALVRKRYPQFNAAQVAEQIRTTADDIYYIPANAPYLEMLGKGRLNMYRALADSAAKSVRNIANTIDKGFGIYPDDTIQITGNFKNFLNPTSNLQITLTSASPYVTVIQNSFNAGAMAMLATASNTTNPFTVYIHPNAPLNETVLLRYGFSDGTYSDFQSFKITVNPDYARIHVNNLDLTVTSKGNIGFNSMQFDQGFGMSYKNSGNIIYEGGLMLASAVNQVSDNIRNDSTPPVPNNRFIPLTNARFIQPSTVATAEVSGSLKDSLASPRTVGVEVNYKAYAWQSAPDDDFVILEYSVTNATTDTIHNLYGGIYADWDVVNAMLNVAEWDSATSMGYVYAPSAPNLYAAIKVLSGNPSYYAIDNSSGPANAITLADGFSDADKFTSLSSGTTFDEAGLGGIGNDVSHVVGSELNTLAPGETKKIAFAVLGQNTLADLKLSAQAAQARYDALHSIPMPTVSNDTICIGATATITPVGGTNFKFYADSLKANLLNQGASFTTPALQNTTTYYVSNADSATESAVRPVTIFTTTPISGFTFSPDTVIIANGGNATFTDTSTLGETYKWYFGDGDSSVIRNPIHQYQSAGNYSVTQIVTDRFGCSDTTMQTLVVQQTVGLEAFFEQNIEIYPNPTSGNVQISFKGNSKAVQVSVYNNLGALIYKQHVAADQQKTQFDLNKHASGVYFIHITSGENYLIRKVQLIK